MNKKVAKNYILNVVYQVFILIIPLVTTPYISRVLGADGVGQYSFTLSLNHYFTLIAALGFGYYAQREIANYQENKHKQSVIFWEIILVRLVSVGISFALNILLVLLGVYKAYASLMLIWSLMIIAQALDITFLFQGNEEFGTIVIRNVAVRFISIFVIFGFVKKTDHVWIYVLSLCLSTLIGNLSLWFKVSKKLVPISFHDLKPRRHVVPTLRLFLPTIATTVYTVLDKTLIGILISETYNSVENGVEVTKSFSNLENGYYEQSEKIVKMCITIITSLGTVMIPRNSNEFSQGNIEKVKNNIYFATNYTWFVGIPVMFGLSALAPNIVPWFLGAGYEKCVLLMQIFTPIILIIGLSNVFGLQFLIPTKRDKIFTKSIICGACVNLLLNLVLIKLFWSVGAVLASIVSELAVTVMMMYAIKDDISIRKIFGQSKRYWLTGILMFVIVYFTQGLLKPSVVNSFILTLEGALVYFVALLVIKDSFIVNIIKIVRKK